MRFGVRGSGPRLKRIDSHEALRRGPIAGVGGIAAALALSSLAPAAAGHPAVQPAANIFRPLTAVSADAPDDAWAVGSTDGAARITHWDGSQWTDVASPVLDASLNDVVALSPSDVWVVGTTNGATRTLTEHWDGSAWTVVASPNPEAFSSLRSVTAVATDDVWAVGQRRNSSEGVLAPLAEHWDGSSWQVVRVPQPPQAHYSEFLGISAAGSDDIWAVGTKGKTISPAPFIEHWDGSAWRVVDAALPPTTGSLSDVVVLSTRNAWAVGTVAYPLAGLIEHWDGHSWTISRSANDHRHSTILSGVSATAADDVCAVGSTQIRDHAQQLPHLEHWNGSRWSVVATPAPRPPRTSWRASVR